VSTRPRATAPLRETPPASAPRDPARKLVPAVERAVRLLDELAAQRKPASLADLARGLDLPKSSVHGLLGTLASLGLVSRLEGNAFALGPRVVHWAHSYALQSDVVGAFNDDAGGIATLGPETTMLAVLDGADVVYLACRQGSRALAVNFRVGGRFPACCTASGKAMMASLPEERVRALMADGGLRRLTRRSVASTAALLRQLDEVRRAGWAVDDEETAEGMHCFGAPVFGAGRDEAVAAVAVSLIKASASPRRIAEVVAAITGLAGRLTERLGGTPPAAWPPAPVRRAA
jgi:DNA-binding IclR family transcriptional regulator